MNNDCCSPNGTGACATESRPAPAETARTFRPSADIYEVADEFVVTLDVPGAAPDGLDIDLDAGTLTVRAAVAPRDRSGARPVHREYGVGDFARSFQVGDGIDAERITAAVDAGVLTVRLPKAEAVRPRKIRVQSAS